jgi:DNA-binding response OmpR family regulator
VVTSKLPLNRTRILTNTHRIPHAFGAARGSGNFLVSALMEDAASSAPASTTAAVAAIADTPSKASQPTNSRPAQHSTRKRHILVVDDEKNIRLTVQHSLIAADYDVDTASNGAEGLDRFHEGHYDLILMDLRMPQINGIEMLREIREHDTHTAAIVITAYLTIDTLLEAFSLGVSDYIRKPFSPNDVREMVRRVMARESLDTHGPTAETAPTLEHARKALAEQDLPRALELAKQAVARDSNNPDSHAFLGILEHLNGDVQAAENSFHEALLLDPQHQLSRDYLFWMQSKGR